ncbi:MAG TPA: hypothetical protein P5556_03610 [Candidatus Gastranaerophilales bacterium]|nr:hypothetical protein [Candidatus Gastranaerophilales bacterium]
MGMDPVLITITPLLFIILIFLSYLNVVESRRGRVVEDKLEKVANNLDRLIDTLSKNN